MTDLTITLGQIARHSPCRSSATKFLASIGSTPADFDPDHRVTLGDIAQSNGLDDAWWVAKCVAGEMPQKFTRQVREIAYRAAVRASVYTTDQRVHDCLSAVRQHLDGVESVDLAAAEAAAWAAAWAAEAARWAAEAAAGDAEAAEWIAEAAAKAGAEAAARAAAEAAGAATQASARAAAEIAAEASAWATEDVEAAASDVEAAAQIADLVEIFGVTECEQ